MKTKSSKLKILGKKLILGYGGGAIADYPWHLSGEKPFTIQDEVAALGCMGTLVSNNMTVIDTANRYGGGKSEKIVGDFLSRCDEKNKFFVITKIEMGKTKEMFERLSKSIQRLKRSPDCVLLHNPDFGNPHLLREAASWLSEEVPSIYGIRFVGFSTEPTREARKWYDEFGFNFIQFPYSETDRRAETEIMPWIDGVNGVIRCANRVLGGPSKEKLTSADVFRKINFLVSKRDTIDIALIGTTNKDHLTEVCEMAEDCHMAVEK